MLLRLLAIASCLFALTASADPNVIVILADDQSPATVSTFGANLYTRTASTPNIDRIAAAGAKFTNAYTIDPVCAPARAILLTSKYPTVNGVTRNGDTLGAAQETVADLLKADGYTTAVIGKWHLQTAPSGLGFDYYYTTVSNNPPYTDAQFSDNGTPVTPTGYITTNINDAALAWLAANKDTAGPFFLFLTHKSPHADFVPRADHAALYSTDLDHPASYFDTWSGRSLAEQNATDTLGSLYADWGGLEGKTLPPLLTGAEADEWAYQAYAKDYLRTQKSLDTSVGEILDYLDNHSASGETGNLTANTIVIYMADNGMLVGHHSAWNKSRTYEECIRVPLLIQYPSGGGSAISVQTRTETVSNADIAPTLLTYAGIAIPAGMVGRSLSELLDGTPATDWRTSLIHVHYEPTSGIVPWYMLRTERYKMITHWGHEWGGLLDRELIDMVADPYEYTNVYDNPGYKKTVKTLRAQMATEMDEAGIVNACDSRSCIRGGSFSGGNFK